MTASSSFVDRYGPWALVTGASSGIGAELAKALAARKVTVGLVARRKERLEQVLDECKATAPDSRIWAAGGISGRSRSIRKTPISST